MDAFKLTTNDGTTTATSPSSVYSRQRSIPTYPLLWLDYHFNKSSKDCQNALIQLIHGTKACLTVESALGQQILPLIHDIAQLDVIYIFCIDPSEHERSTKKWMKIKGVYADIKSICEKLRVVVKQYNQDSIAVSFAVKNEEDSSVNLNQLDPSFMYTQIFKEILFEIDHDERSITNFALKWCQHCMNNPSRLEVIAKFEREYRSQFAITWYTRESFVYETLNRALQTVDGGSIIAMGFFIRDLHRAIEELYQKQIGNYHGKPFIVYRGQGLFKSDFEKHLKTKGGLMSFNNFLSTSFDPKISLLFTESALQNTGLIGILFQIFIDPSISSTPFASIRDISYFQTEEQILFSMHSVFCVDDIHRIDSNTSVYQVDLRFTADDDREFRILTDHIHQEVVGETGWNRLGNLLLKLGQVDKAEELYTALLQQTPDIVWKSHYRHQLELVKNRQGDYENAIKYYKESLDIPQKLLSPNHPALATSYCNIASTYHRMGEYSKALSFYEKALDILQKTLPANHSHIAYSYDNIGSVYLNMEKYEKAASYSENAPKILKNSLPSNHPTIRVVREKIAYIREKL